MRQGLPHEKSQSAMEYLMTYGWAILIIAVVLGALFSLGVFNSANFAPRAPTGSCKILRVAGTYNLEGTCGGVLPQSVAQFDGQSSYITAPSVNLGSSETISLWFKQSTLISNRGLIGLDTYGYFFMAGVGAATSLGVYNGVSNYGPYASVGNTNWHLATFIGSGTTYSIYLDGKFISSATNNPSTSGSVTIGAYPYGSSFWNGYLSNVQFYNTSLDQSQITTLYLKGIGAAPIDPNHIVGWWPLNGDANDYSGNNNNGAPTNVVYTSSWTSGYTPP